MPYFHAIDPVALQVGPIGIHWYGLMYVLGFFFSWWLGKRRLAQGRLAASAEQFSDLLFYGMLGVILGGRLGYVFFYGFADLIADPLMILRVWEGGMSFHGGLLGVLVSLAWWSRRRGLHFFDTVDFVAPLVPIGLGLGRLGNFIGGELWGRHTDLPWGVIFPRAVQHLGTSTEELRALYLQGALNAEARHPSQLYEMALEGVVLFIVLWIYSSKPRPRYAVSGLFALLYGIFRIGVELLREPDQHLGFLAFDWLTMGQLLSLPLVMLGVALLILASRQPKVAQRVPKS